MWDKGTSTEQGNPATAQAKEGHTMNRIHPTTWNEKPGTNSWGDGVAQCLIGARVKGHTLAGDISKLLVDVCFSQIRRLDKNEG